MATWTDELKQEAIDAYLKAEPTAETSVEIIKEIAENMEQSANGVRMILVQAGVYVKKDAGSPKTPVATKEGEAPKRVSKESSINAFVAALNAIGVPVDEEITSKLTGKAAVYLLSVVKAIQAKAE